MCNSGECLIESWGLQVTNQRQGVVRRQQPLGGLKALKSRSDCNLLADHKQLINVKKD